MDVYKIAVRIALTNGMSPVLAIISRDLLGINTSVKQIESGFGRWALAAGGAAAVMAGSAMIGGLIKMADRGAEVNHQLELMKLQGMQVGEIHGAAAKAMEVSGSVLTTTYTENLKHLRELRYAFGNTDTAMKYLEDVSKANATLNAMKGGGTDQVWELVKGLEQKGLTADPATFMSYVAQMTKAVVASGGMVTPAAFQNTFKYGRTAMLGWDETFTTQYLPRLIQSMASRGGGGAGGPGNALMSAFAKVVQGQMPKSAALMWKQMGLATLTPIAGSSQVLTNVKTKGTFEENPYEWVQKVLVPALAAHKITDPKKIIDIISQMFPVRTASSIVTEMALQGRAILGDQSPFEKDAKLQREAFDQRMSYDELIKGDYQTMMQAFHAQWDSLNDSIGSAVSAPGSPLLTYFADVIVMLHKASALAQANPGAIRMAADAIAALAAALIVGGLIALGVAIFGLVGAGGILVALAAGLAAFAALNWKSIKAATDQFTSWFNKMGADLQSKLAPPKALDGFRHGADHLHDELQQFFHDHFGTAAPSAQKSSYIMPAGGAQVIQVRSVINMDGRKVGEAVTNHQVRAASGPAQGAPYHDGTYSTSPVDLVTI